MRPNNDLILNAVSAIINQNSSAVWAQMIYRASFQLVVSGTAAGTIQIQGSNDQAIGVPPGQFQPTNWTNIGASVTVNGAAAYMVPDLTSSHPQLEMSYEYLRLTYTSTKAGVQTIGVLADTGVKQSQTITTVADVAGSLNNTYLLLSSVNVTSKTQKDFYIWFNINSAGTDPSLPGKTGIPITGATNVSANTLATSIRSALNALTNDFTAAGSNAAVIATNVAFGPVPAAVDGAVATHFTFGAATAGIASNLNNTYFLLQDASTAHSYYVWFNVDSIGTDPVIVGRTAAPVAISSGSTAATVGTALASEIASLNGAASFSASGTTTVTVTMLATGPFTPMSDGAVPTGFTFTVTAPTGTLTARMKSING